MTLGADAVIIGAGHHGLVAANLLADHGWDVIVVEAADTPGGAVRTAEITVPGFHHDLFSAFYPLGASSPVIAGLHLEEYGLRRKRAPLVLANPTPDGPTAVLSTDVDVTAASLDAFAPGDGDAWRALFEEWLRLDPHLVGSLMTPLPPVRNAVPVVAKILRHGGLKELARFARFAMLPVRRMGEEHFSGAGGSILLAGNALHADLAPESTGSGIYGWLLCMLGQQVGFPVPEGGAGRLTEALVARMQARGVEMRLGERVVAVDIARGRATGVRTASGETISARRAVLADVGAPDLYLNLVGPEHLPAATRRDIASFEWDVATFKVDWALSAPIPWSDPQCRQAGTVHLADSVDELSDVANALATRRISDRPFCLIGQQSMTDPTRMPPGAETAWAYSHVPHNPQSDLGPDGLTGRWDDHEADVFAARMEDRIENLAPGFRQSILGRHIFTPPGMQAADTNLMHGAISGGTAKVHQQLIFRPVPGLGRAETPISNLYLASASAHPGGGVHGACGSNAARAALAHARADVRQWRRPPRPRGTTRRA